MRHLVRFAPLFAFGLLAIGCPSSDDQTVIKNHLRAAVEAAQDKRPNGVLEHVADDFRGPNGMSKADAKRVLVGRLLRGGWMKVFERSLDVSVEDETAAAALHVVIAKGEKVERFEDLMPTDGSAGRFDIKLEKRDGSWWIVAANYIEEAAVR